MIVAIVSAISSSQVRFCKNSDIFPFKSIFNFNKINQSFQNGDVNMDCRGHEKRLRIVQEYKIIPIAHIKLLNGKIISSDAGGDITDSYFMFNCISKTNNEREIIYCGKPTAIDFCNLTNQKLPDLFNPLKCTSVSGKLNKNNIREAEMIDKKWNPMRKQLYNATMLLIAIFDAKPDTPLFVIKAELETYVDREPFLARIKAINTIISKTNKTMRDIIDELGKNNDLKSFSFDLLIQKLNEKNIEQYFEKDN